MPPEIVSRYAPARYGEVFYRMMLSWHPTLVVDLGAASGYSTYWMARGLKKTEELGRAIGRLDAYDTGSLELAQKILEREGLQTYATLKQEDPFEAAKNYKDKEVWILHVNLHNTAETLRKIIDSWDKKVGYGCLLMFEGGDRPDIRQELETNQIINTKYVYGTYFDWPSLAVLLKKTND